MSEKQQLTKAGYKKIEEELRKLIDVERPANNEALKNARENGDLSENADYDAARNKQAEIEAKIQEYENILSNCVIIDDKVNKNRNKVSLGSKVTVHFLESGREETFLIVGSVEADAFAKHISNESPLGKALLNKTLGDVVEVKAVKTSNVQILKIDY